MKTSTSVVPMYLVGLRECQCYRILRKVYSRIQELFSSKITLTLDEKSNFGLTYMVGLILVAEKEDSAAWRGNFGSHWSACNLGEQDHSRSGIAENVGRTDWLVRAISHAIRTAVMLHLSLSAGADRCGVLRLAARKQRRDRKLTHRPCIFSSTYKYDLRRKSEYSHPREASNDERYRRLARMS